MYICSIPATAACIGSIQDASIAAADASWIVRHGRCKGRCRGELPLQLPFAEAMAGMPLMLVVQPPAAVENMVQPPLKKWAAMWSVLDLYRAFHSAQASK